MVTIAEALAMNYGAPRSGRSGITYMPQVRLPQQRRSYGTPVPRMPSRRPNTDDEDQLANLLTPNFEGIMASQARAQQAAPTGGGNQFGGLGYLIGGAAKLGMGALDVLDMGRRASVLGVEGLANLLPQELEWLAPPTLLVNENRDETRSAWERFRDPSYGWGQIAHQIDTGNPTLDKWLNRTQGLAGDIALDPLTYLTFGVGAVPGKAGRSAALGTLLRAQREAKAGEEAAAAFRALGFAEDALPDVASAARRAATPATKEGYEALRGLGFTDEALGFGLGAAPQQVANVAPRAIPQSLLEAERMRPLLGTAEDLSTYGQRGLSAATAQQLETMGLRPHSVRFMGRSIPGTEGVSRALSRPAQALRPVGRALPGAAALREARTPTGYVNQNLNELFERVITGKGNVSIERALDELATNEQMRRIGGTFEALANRELRILRDQTKGLDTATKNEMIRRGELGLEDNVFTEYARKVREGAQAAGVTLPELQDGVYVLPHSLSREFRDHLAKVIAGKDPRVEDFKQFAGITNQDLLEEGGFLSRRVFRTGPGGAAQEFKIGDKVLRVEEGSIDELNRKLADIFPEFKGKIYETDPMEAWRRYINATKKDVAMRGSFRENLARGVPGYYHDPGVPENYDPFSGREQVGTMLNKEGEEVPVIRVTANPEPKPSSPFYKMVEDQAETRLRNLEIATGRPQVTRQEIAAARAAGVPKGEPVTAVQHPGIGVTQKQVAAELERQSAAERQRIAAGLDVASEQTFAPIREAREAAQRGTVEAEAATSRTMQLGQALTQQRDQATARIAAIDTEVADLQRQIESIVGKGPSRLKRQLKARRYALLNERKRINAQIKDLKRQWRGVRAYIEGAENAAVLKDKALREAADAVKAEGDTLRHEYVTAWNTADKKLTEAEQATPGILSERQRQADTRRIKFFKAQPPGQSRESAQVTRRQIMLNEAAMRDRADDLQLKVANLDQLLKSTGADRIPDDQWVRVMEDRKIMLDEIGYLSADIKVMQDRLERELSDMIPTPEDEAWYRLARDWRARNQASLETAHYHAQAIEKMQRFRDWRDALRSYEIPEASTVEGISKQAPVQGPPRPTGEEIYRTEAAIPRPPPAPREVAPSEDLRRAAARSQSLREQIADIKRQGAERFPGAARLDDRLLEVEYRNRLHAERVEEANKLRDKLNAAVEKWRKRGPRGRVSQGRTKEFWERSKKAASESIPERPPGTERGAINYTTDMGSHYIINPDGTSTRIQMTEAGRVTSQPFDRVAFVHPDDAAAIKAAQDAGVGFIDNQGHLYGIRTNNKHLDKAAYQAARDAGHTVDESIRTAGGVGAKYRVRNVDARPSVGKDAAHARVPLEYSADGTRMARGGVINSVSEEGAKRPGAGLWGADFVNLSDDEAARLIGENWTDLTPAGRRKLRALGWDNNGVPPERIGAATPELPEEVFDLQRQVNAADAHAAAALTERLPRDWGPRTYTPEQEQELARLRQELQMSETGLDITRRYLPPGAPTAEQPALPPLKMGETPFVPEPKPLPPAAGKDRLGLGDILANVQAAGREANIPRRLEVARQRFEPEIAGRRQRLESVQGRLRQTPSGKEMLTKEERARVAQEVQAGIEHQTGPARQTVEALGTERGETLTRGQELEEAINAVQGSYVENLKNQEASRVRQEKIQAKLEKYNPPPSAVSMVKAKGGAAATKKRIRTAANGTIAAENAQPLTIVVDELDKLIKANPTGADELMGRMEGVAAGFRDDLAQLTRGTDLSAVQARQIDAEARSGKLAPVLKAELDTAYGRLWNDGDILIDAELKRMYTNLVTGLESKRFGKVFTLYTNFFKTYATLSPGFHVRNALSAVFMNTSEGVGFGTQTRGLRLWREFANAQDPTAWFARQTPEVRNAFTAVFGSGSGGQFFERGVGELSVGRTRLKEELFANWLTKGSQRVGQDWVEGPVRLALALDTTTKGGSIDRALQRITRVHFDYSQTSKFDERMKRYIPFWTFMSRNLPLQFTQMWTKPKVYAWYNSFVRNFGVPAPPFTPQYIEQGGGINTGTSLPGGLPGVGEDQPLWLTPDLPHLRLQDDLNRLANAASGQNMGQVLTNLNPAMTAPFEFMLGQDFFTGKKYGPKDQSKAGIADIPFLPFMAALNQVHRGPNGDVYVSDKARNTGRALIPFYDRAARLLPGSVGEEGGDRQLESWARFLGLPIRTISQDQIENEQLRRMYELRDQAAAQRAMMG